MVAYLVRNHVGGGKVVVPGPIARHLAELLEELHVEVDGFLAGDVEGAGGGLGHAARAHWGRSGIVDQLGGTVLEVVLAKDLGPFIFGGAEDAGDIFCQLVALGAGGLLSLGGLLAEVASALAEKFERIDFKNERKDKNQEEATSSSGTGGGGPAA